MDRVKYEQRLFVIKSNWRENARLHFGSSVGRTLGGSRSWMERFGVVEDYDYLSIYIYVMKMW
jgi:hypothetical protein